MSDRKKSLAHIELLEWLPSDALAVLEARCRWGNYTPNEQIIDQGSDNRDIFFVVNGAVRVVNFSTTGREIAFANLSSGSYFGEISAIDGQPRTAAIVAIEETTLASLSSETFLDLLFERPPIAMKVMRQLCSIIRVADDRIMDLSTLRAVQRVYIEVLRLSGADAADADAPKIEPIPSHADIASLASTTRETVARVLSELSQSGIVLREGKTLYIKEPAKLRRLADTTGLDI